MKKNKREKYETIIQEIEHISTSCNKRNRWYIAYCRWYRERCEAIGVKFPGKEK